MRLVDADFMCKEIAESIRQADEWAKESREKQDTIGLKFAAETSRSLLSMLSRIQDTPTITIEEEPVRQWIPCSERLPEKDTPVLIFAAGHRVTAYYDAVKGAFRLTEANYLFYRASAVTHWMPLPEPPEKE